MLSFKKFVLLVVVFMIMAGAIYANKGSATSNVTINPNPMEKSTLITLRIGQKINAQVFIESVDGSVIKTFYSGEFVVGTYEFFWNRLDNAGVYVPEGEYNLVIIYELRYTSTKKTIILK